VAVANHDFIQFLERLSTSRNRRALAELKRSLAFAPGAYWPAYPYVEPFVSGLDGWSREAHYVVAGLFAVHPMVVAERTLARALGDKFRTKGVGSLEARFLALLDSDRDQIGDRLRRAVVLVADRGLDWAQLLRDLVRWFHPLRFVQERWAREFYQVAAATDAAEEEER